MYIEVDKNKIRYNEYGKDKDKHILFIHGLGSSSLIWRDIPEALSYYFHTISVDLVGFGASDKPPVNYTISYFSQTIEKFIERIGIGNDEKIIIVGHSLGGYIALEYAIENLSNIEKLVLIDSSGLLETPTPLLNQYLEAALTADTNQRYKRLRTVFENLVAYPTRLLPVTVDIFISVIDQSGAKHAFQSAFNNSTYHKIDKNRLEKINKIPCLIIWGEKDKLIPVEFATKFKEIIFKSSLAIVEDTGHSPFFEKTATVYQKLLNFLFDEKSSFDG